MIESASTVAAENPRLRSLLEQAMTNRTFGTGLVPMSESDCALLKNMVGEEQCRLCNEMCSLEEIEGVSDFLRGFLSGATFGFIHRHNEEKRKQLDVLKKRDEVLVALCNELCNRRKGNVVSLADRKNSATGVQLELAA